MSTEHTATPERTATPEHAVTLEPRAAAAPMLVARPRLEPVTDADRAVIAEQLGRPPRALRAVAARCPAGHPAVVQTSPRLENGTPFPTLYYLTCPRLCSLVGGLESAGVMREMTDRLGTDAELAEHYRRAHESYLAERDAIDPLGHRVSAGGMPGRVKCLHVHLAHSLAHGPGVNPFGDETLELLRGRGWPSGDCAERSSSTVDVLA